MKIIVCGGRDFNNSPQVLSVIKRMHEESAYGVLHGVTHVIHGGCRGADMLADAAARRLGIQPVRCDALWDFYKNKSAGPVRNSRMIALMPDLVVAFPGASGTEDMVHKAKKFGIRVVRIEPEDF